MSEYSMMDLFRMEIETQVDKLTQGLLDIEQGDTGADILEGLMRAAHSIKGAARMVNVEPIIQVSHEIEDCFVALQNHKIIVDKHSIDQLLAGIKLISQVVLLNDDEVKRWEASQQFDVMKLVDALRKVHGGEGRNCSSEITIEAPVFDYYLEEKNRNASIENVSALTIRIPVDRLDRMLDLAGKSLVQSHELNAIMPDLWQIKHQQQLVISQLNRLQENLSENNVNVSTQRSIKTLLSDVNRLRHQYADGIAKLDIIDRRSSTISEFLHREIMASRMRPISEIFGGLPLLVREFSHRLKKDVRLEMSGLDTMVDRHVLERIDTPIKHLVQNAIDHGVELPADRQLVGKDQFATLSITVSLIDGLLRIVMEDDGRGVDYEKIKEVIVKKGLQSMTEANQLQHEALLDYLFVPGVSTQENVNEFSGRGVGLDLVKDVVTRLNGSVQAFSGESSGLRFQLYLPQTISVMRVLMTTICGESYAFPKTSISKLVQVKVADLIKLDHCYYVPLDDKKILLIHANEVFQGTLPNSLEGQVSVIIIGNGQHMYGVVVDKTHGVQELSIHKLAPELGKINGISSAAILNSGELTLIIDIEDYIHLIDAMKLRNPVLRLCKEEKSDVCELLSVLVVDDSITVREVQRKILKEQHFRVSVAEDGVSALLALQKQHFDILITDVDMPNMDGLRLINEVRFLGEYANMPILVISNREKTFVKQSVILDEKTLYYSKDQFSEPEFLSFIQTLSNLVANNDTAFS